MKKEEIAAILIDMKVLSCKGDSMERYSGLGNIKKLEAIARQYQKEEIAIGVLQLSSELMYLHGCVKRGRGSDLYPDQPCRNVFEYIKELEHKLGNKS